MRPSAKTNARFVVLFSVLAFGWLLRDHLGLLTEMWTPPDAPRIATGLLDASERGRGEEVLPSTVRQTIAMLRAHDASSYEVVGRFRANDEYRQRLAEGAWPIRPRTDSPFVIGYEGELTSRAECHVIDRARGVALADCRR